MAVTVQRESKEYLAGTITASVPVLDAAPLLAFTAVADEREQPDAEAARPDVWIEGTWQGPTVFDNGKYRRQFRTPLIGVLPVLEPGEYQMWLKVIDDPEEPVMPAGVIFIG